MTARLSTGGGATDEATAVALLHRAGLSAHSWGNGPHDRYQRHRHDHHKVLLCVAGDITFHTDAGDFPMTAGDRLDIEAGTDHAATVGSRGVRCVEAPAGRPTAAAGH